jgi:hypothetical protein
MQRHLILATLAFLIGLQAKTQEIPSVRTIQETVLETLSIISAPTDQKDWEKFRKLFLPCADLTVVSDNSLGQKNARTFSLEEFVRMMQRNTSTSPFSEQQINLTVQHYNGIAQAFQTYELNVGDQKHLGINSYQLVFDGNTWWIANLVWASNQNGVEIPEQYMPKQ